MASKTPLQQLVEEYEDKLDTMLKYEEEIKEKPYYFENRSVFIFTVFLGFFCSLVSIVGGSPFAGSLVRHIVHNPIAQLIIGFSLLLFVEFGHHLLTPKVVKQWIVKEQKVKKTLLLFVVALRFISAFMTISGFVIAIEVMKGEPEGLIDIEELKAPYKAELDSTEANIKILLGTTWDGNVTRTANEGANKLIPQKDSIRSEMKKEVRVARAKNKALWDKHSQSGTKDSWYLGLLAFLLELVMIAAIWNQVYYKVQSTKEALALKQKRDGLKVASSGIQEEKQTETEEKPTGNQRETNGFPEEKKTIKVPNFSQPMTASEIKTKIKQYNWKLKNGKGKKQTALENIERLELALDQILKQTS